MYLPNFTITNKILTQIGRIEAAKTLISSSPLLPYWEKKFQNEAKMRSVHHGTHLEGNKLNFSQAKKVIEGEKITARKRDIQEVINYRQVIDFIGKIKSRFNEKLLKKLHTLTTKKILSPEEVGRYRQKTVVIRSSLTGNISFRPPPPVEVPYLIDDFFDWLKDPASSPQKTHPVLKAGVVHYELSRIHPFIDGNGRVARAATTFILFKEDYDVRRFFSLEEHYDRDARAYYKALQSVSRSQNSPDSSGGDLTPWLEYFTKGLAIEFNGIKEKIEKISRDLNFKNALGGQIYLNERQLKIIEHIQEMGFLHNKNFSKLFPDLSDDTVLRELKELIKKNIIKKKGRTKAARYVLRQ